MPNTRSEVAATTPTLEDIALVTAPLLTVEGLNIAYKHRRGWHDAVVTASFSIGRGESFGLVGESGSGKTSVALSILRYLPKTARVTARRMLFAGTELQNLNRSELQAIRGSQISAVYQDPSAALNPALTIGLQVSEILRSHKGLSGKEARERVIELLDRMRLRQPERLLDLYPHELSGGMQQRVTIAMAVALKPALIVLDEPTTALDASVRAEITTLLEELRATAGTSFLVISHDIDLVRRLTDRVAVMYAGHIVETGASSTVFAEPGHTYTKQLVESHQAPLQSRRMPSGAAPVALRTTSVRKLIARQPILEDVNIAIRQGETLGLIGESGSGKSTLARLIAGLDRPSSGRIEIDGQAVSGLVERRRPQIRRLLQMVFQSPDTTLNPRHKIRRILNGGRLDWFVKRQERARNLAGLLEAVRLPADFLERYPRELSGGQRQRIAIARAFAQSPRIIILDEPTSALDASVQASVLALLKDLQKHHDTTYLFISHDLRVVRHMADWIAVIYRGQIVETGTTEEIFQRPRHAYTQLLLQSALEAPIAGGAPG